MEIQIYIYIYIYNISITEARNRGCVTNSKLFSLKAIANTDIVSETLGRKDRRKNDSKLL